MTMWRLAGLGAFAIAAAAVAAPASFGAKPDRQPALSGPLDFPAGLVCPFAVHGEVAANRQIQTTFSNGKVQITGFFASKIVNVENDKELTLVTPGSLRERFVGDTLYLASTGPLIYFLFPGDAGPGDTTSGRTYLIRGNTNVIIDLNTFAFVHLGYSGSAVDVCELLA